jgi:hypothetical protein
MVLVSTDRLQNRYLEGFPAATFVCRDAKEIRN